MIYEVRRLPIVDDTASGKSLDARIKDLCELMAVADLDLVSMTSVSDQLVLVFREARS